MGEELARRTEQVSGLWKAGPAETATGPTKPPLCPGSSHFWGPGRKAHGGLKLGKALVFWASVSPFVNNSAGIGSLRSSPRCLGSRWAPPQPQGHRGCARMAARFAEDTRKLGREEACEGHVLWPCALLDASRPSQPPTLKKAACSPEEATCPFGEDNTVCQKTAQRQQRPGRLGDSRSPPPQALTSGWPWLLAPLLPLLTSLLVPWGQLSSHLASSAGWGLPKDYSRAHISPPSGSFLNSAPAPPGSCKGWSKRSSWATAVPPAPHPAPHPSLVDSDLCALPDSSTI